MNLLMASDIKRMMTVHARSSLQILDSGAGISGVGEQWKMTDILWSSTYSVQGVFGEPMTPIVQGFLGPDKLPAVLVLGMRDDINSLSSILRANEHTGPLGKVAIFTESGAIILKSESCQELLQQAIHQGTQTHVADQVDGIYVLRPASMTTVGQSTMHLTCCGTTRNFRKIRLQSSLLNCDYTLQVLQRVSTRCNQRLHCNDVCVCFYYSNNTQVQTATFQTNGLRSVRLYVHNT